MTETTLSETDPNPAVAEMDEPAFIAHVLKTEAEAIARIGELLGRGAEHPQQALWRRAIDVLSGCDGQVIVSGMGKSGLIGAKISATMSSLGQPSSVVHPAEAMHGDLGRITRDDIVLLLSASGETEEVVNLAAILKADGVTRLGVSQSPDTTLARLSDVHLSMGDVTEACPLKLAPTTSTAVMLAIGDALALAVSRRRNFGHVDFQRHHPGGLLGAGLKPITDALRFRVGDNLPVVDDSCTVRQALEKTTGDRRTGAIVLVDAVGRLSGIFTDADFRRLMRSNPDGMDIPIRDVMTRHPLHLTTDSLVRDAVRLMRERRLDEIPVLDGDGKPVGLVDVQDLISMKVVKE